MVQLGGKAKVIKRWFGTDKRWHKTLVLLQAVTPFACIGLRTVQQISADVDFESIHGYPNFSRKAEASRAESSSCNDRFREICWPARHSLQCTVSLSKAFPLFVRRGRIWGVVNIRHDGTPPKFNCSGSNLSFPHLHTPIMGAEIRPRSTHGP